MSARVVVVVGAVAVGVAGCGSGSSGRDVAKDYLNNEKLERSIERSVRVQRHREVFVSCPPFVRIAKGGTFRCVAATKGAPAYFRVTMRDNKGNVHFEAVPR